MSRSPEANRPLTISFPPGGGLPRGGYYYAVVVLTHYVEGTEPRPPACAVSSDMRRTPYGYPRRDRWVKLTLYPAPERDWCVSGEYEGAVYAVPHPPRCSAKQPCAGKSTEYGTCPPAPEECTPKTGVLPIYVYSYPGGLPRPVDRTARIVGRFKPRFAPHTPPCCKQPH
jgi:hypothetical protein